jgi:ethanolamine utilization microcompartment shell protein EutL
MKSILVFLLFAGSVWADSAEDKILQQALSQTQNLLTSPTQRNQAISGDPAAKAADAQLQNLMGSPALTEQSYALAAEIMGGLVQAHGADTQAMQKALDQAARDPAAFLNSLTPEQREKIKKMATEIESNKPRQ